MPELFWLYPCPHCGSDITEFEKILNKPELYLCSECRRAYTKKELEYNAGIKTISD